MSRAQGLLSGGIATFAGRSVSVLSAFAITAIAARVLAKDAFGALILAISLTNFLAIFGCLGFHLGLARRVADDFANGVPAQARSAIFGGLMLTLTFSSALGALLFIGLAQPLLVATLNSPLLYSIRYLLLAWLTLRALQLTLGGALRGMQNLTGATAVDNALSAALGVLAFVWVSVFITTPTLPFVTTMLVAALATAVLTGIVIVRKAVAVELMPALRNTGKLLELGPPLMLFTVLALAVNDTHMWLLSALQSEEQVANYGAAYQLVKLARFPVLVINAVIPPFIVKLHQQRSNNLQPLMRGSASLCAAPSIIVVVLFLAFPEQILTLIFGANLAVAAAPLRILALGHLINVLSGSPGMLLAMTGHGKSLIVMSSIALVIGVLISVYAIPHFGVVGAAWGATTAIVTQKLALWSFAARRLGVFTHAGARPFVEACRRLLQRRRPT